MRRSRKYLNEDKSPEHQNKIRLKRGIIVLIVLLSRAAHLNMYGLHFVRQVILLDVAINLMS